MATALRLAEPRLKPQGNTFVNQDRYSSENSLALDTSMRSGTKAMQRSHSYSGYVPYHLVAEPLSPICPKPATKFMCDGAACEQGRGRTAPQLPLKACAPGGGQLPLSGRRKEAERRPSPEPVSGDEEFTCFAGGWDQARYGRGEAWSDITDSKESSSTEDDCPGMDSIDAMVAWPDTDDEDCDSLAFGGHASVGAPWPKGVQDISPASAAPAPTTPGGSFVQAQDQLAATNSLSLPHPGGCTPSWSPTYAVVGEPARFFPAASPSTPVTASSGDNFAEGADGSPSAVDMYSWLRALRHARDGATVSNIDSVRDMLQQLPPVQPCAPLAHDGENAEAGALQSPLPPSCSAPPTEAPAVGGCCPLGRRPSEAPTVESSSLGRRPSEASSVEHCPFGCQLSEAPPPVHEKRSYAAGAAPPRAGERPPPSTAARAEKRHALLAGAREGSVTTLMVRNLPLHLSQQRLIEELNLCGFACLYDFCYSPLCSFDTGRGKGFAFVNFLTEEAASDFAAAWHGTRRFGVPRSEPAMNISAAAVQGKEANLAKWGTKRAVRIRNPKLRPFVRD